MASRPRGRPRKVLSICSFPSHFSLSLSHIFSSLKLNSWAQTQSHIVLLKIKNFVSFSYYFLSYSHTHFVLQKDTRLAAALDAMRPYGFPQDLVEVTVGELLNVGQLLFLFSMFQCVFESKKQ